MPWTEEDRKTFQCSSRSPSTSFLSTIPSVTLGRLTAVSTNPHNRESGKAGLLLDAIFWTIPRKDHGTNNTPKSKTVSIARYCECQDALMRTRTCRPTFFVMSPLRNRPASIYHPWPAAHPRPSGYSPATSSSQLHTYPSPPPTFIPLTHLNSQLLP